MKRAIFIFIVVAAIALPAAFSSCSNAPSGSKAKAEQWEYKMENVSLYYDNRTESVDKLNSLGAEGWELVSVEGSLSFFKRRLP